MRAALVHCTRHHLCIVSLDSCTMLILRQPFCSCDAPLTVLTHKSGKLPTTFSTYAWNILHHICTASAGILAISCRQNNVVWVAFCMGIGILCFIEKGEILHRTFQGECQRLAKCFVSGPRMIQSLFHPAAHIPLAFFRGNCCLCCMLCA